MAKAEQFGEPYAHHGEGPVWYDGWGAIRFVDMLAGDVLTVDFAGKLTERLHIGDVAAVFRPRIGGGMVAAAERSFVLVDDDGTVHSLGEVWTDPGIRMNEGGCDPDGRFYCGSMAYAATPGAGTLYRLDTDHQVSTVLSEVTISNGLGWSPDWQTAYYVDTPTGRIDAFDYSAEQGLTNRRTAVEVDGRPDGLSVDAEGYLWVALFGGSAVHRYAPSGQLDGVVELPVSNVTACTFGGPDLDELYITTSRHNLPEDADQPEAGALFRYHPGVRGLPVLPYAG